MDLQSNMDTTGRLFKRAFKDFNAEMQECIQNCMVCHQICLQTITHCLQKGGFHSEAEHIKTLQDCAEICSVSADFMVRNSELHPSVCRVCAEACQACAESCNQMDDQDEMIKSCVDICRRCAQSCERMAAKH